jgi:predicted nucleotidyltransferase
VTTWTEKGRFVAAEFTRRAAQSFGDRIERVILFGSVARGTDGPDSDVDLIVVADAPDRELRDGLDAIAFDLILAEHRSPVFLLYPVDVYERARAAGSELIVNATREGMVLWMRSDERSSAPA